MTGAPRDLGRRVSVMTGGLAVALAAGCGLGWGLADALGALAGSAIMLANFAGLRWAVSRAVAGSGRTPAPGANRGLWLGAIGVRLGLVALALGLAVTLGRVGLKGLLVSLAILPLTVVLAGLREARAA